MTIARTPLFGRVISSFGSNRITVAQHEYPGGLVAEPHFHDQSYLTIITSGSTRESFSGRDELLATNDVHLMIAGDRHTNQYLTATRCFHFKVDALLHDVRNATPGPRRDRRSGALARLICSEADATDDLSATAIEGLLFALLSRPVEVSNTAPAWMSRVDDLLWSSFASTLTLEDIAKVAGVHQAHLCREFHRHKRRTIGTYIRELRIDRSRALLEDSSDSLADIALQCGFSDQSHFSNAFKRVMRMTPRQYRQISNQQSDRSRRRNHNRLGHALPLQRE
jgi:AraC family transcriptional regulator